MKEEEGARQPARRRPTGKTGGKHHLTRGGNSAPRAVVTTAANADDVTRTLAPVDGIPPVAGRLGRSRKRSDALPGDKDHDSNPNRWEPRKHRVLPVIFLKGGPGISQCPDGRRRKSPGPVDHAAVGAPR
ncbi:hypothetical protein [Streptomyces sp. NPDC015350]|uniref:hypothetical protein n=1 Tax=Streptomyces sp. NPDC015350 TaxID=3364955 RepID=UPI0036FAF78A